MMKRHAALVLAAMCIMTLAACHKKPKVTPPPPPPPPPSAATENTGRPVINFFTAEPTSVEKGQGSSLRWSVSNATSITIDQGIGDVSPNGRRSVYPASTTTYSLHASNAQGQSADATVTVNISTPPPVAPPVQSGPAESAASRLASQVKDLYFDYDKDDIRDDQQSTLQADAAALKSIFADSPDFVVTIEGNCDERGSAEYNLGLGDRRASKTKEALVGLGVPAEKLKTISYGKERPVGTDESESCYQQNRHAHFAPSGQ